MDYRRLANPFGSNGPVSNPAAIGQTEGKWTASVVRDGKVTGSVSTRGTFAQARAVVDRKHPKAKLIEMQDVSGQLFAERFLGKWYAGGKRVR